MEEAMSYTSARPNMELERTGHSRRFLRALGLFPLWPVAPLGRWRGLSSFSGRFRRILLLVVRTMAPVIVLAASVIAGGQSLADSDLSNSRDAGFATDPAVIKALAAEAYVWGLGPEFIDRFSKYNTIIAAPFNPLQYASVPAPSPTPPPKPSPPPVLYFTAF